MAETELNDCDYIAQELKKNNKLLYLTTLYLDEKSQPAARAIISLYLELKKIPETISEPLLGDIRTTWWREAIEKGDIDTAGAPLAREILRAINDHQLDKNLFYTLLEGISRDLYIQLYETENELNEYHEMTAGATFSLLSQLPANGTDLPTAGRIYGISQHLYETPIARARHKHFWSNEALKEANISHQTVLEGVMTEEIEKFYKLQISNILSDLDILNKSLIALPTSSKAAFAPLTMIRPWLKAIEKTENPLTQITPILQLSFQWHLWRCGRRGQF